MTDDARSSFPRGAGKARESLENAAGAMRDGIDAASAAAAASVERIDEAGRQALDVGQKSWDIGRKYGTQAQERAQQAADMLADGASKSLRVTSERVRAEPLLSLLVAGAVGYGLARFLHRR